jgi:large subunit ribosomal protein L25
MSATSELTALPRDVIGKSSKRLASINQIPAVLYGHNREARPIAVDRHAFELFMAHHAAGAALVELNVEGEKKAVNAMVREVQRSPVKGNILHVDFVAVSMSETVHAVVPIHLVNDPAGVKAGGILTINMHEINIEALPGDLPEGIEWDVSALEVGDAVHLSEIAAPAGVRFLDDPESIVASVQAPRVEIEEEVVEEAEEPEIIGAKAEEEE